MAPITINAVVTIQARHLREGGAARALLEAAGHDPAEPLPLALGLVEMGILERRHGIKMGDDSDFDVNGISLLVFEGMRRRGLLPEGFTVDNFDEFVEGVDVGDLPVADAGADPEAPEQPSPS